jgi:hypothetical protein
MDLRELIQQFHHPVVVFECVEPDPGKAILARDHVFVERLVHVPEKHQPDLRGTVMTHSRSLSQQVYQGGDRLGIRADKPMNNTDENRTQIFPK